MFVAIPYCVIGLLVGRYYAGHFAYEDLNVAPEWAPSIMRAIPYGIFWPGVLGWRLVVRVTKAVLRFLNTIPVPISTNERAAQIRAQKEALARAEALFDSDDNDFDSDSAFAQALARRRANTPNEAEAR